VVALGPAGSADSAATSSRLPTTDQVARIFPSVAGGARQVARPVEFGLPVDDCDTQLLGHPRRAVTATYRPPTATDGTQVAAGVFRFRTERRTARLVGRLRALLRACEGFHDHGPFFNDLRVLRRPGLADRSLAFEASFAYFDALTNTVRSSYRVVAVVQRDDRLVTVEAARSEVAPDVDDVVRLARLVLRTSAR
jgi:hypothetical protein